MLCYIYPKYILSLPIWYLSEWYQGFLLSDPLFNTSKCVSQDEAQVNVIRTSSRRGNSIVTLTPAETAQHCTDMLHRPELEQVTRTFSKIDYLCHQYFTTISLYNYLISNSTHLDFYSPRQSFVIERGLTFLKILCDFTCNRPDFLKFLRVSLISFWQP